MSMKFPLGTISRRYSRICDSPISFNCDELTVEELRWLLFRIVSTAATSPGEAPIPLNRRMGAMPPDVSGIGVAPAEPFAPFADMLPLSPRPPQAVRAVEIRTREAMMRTRVVLLVGAVYPDLFTLTIYASAMRQGGTSRARLLLNRDQRLI